SRYTSELIRSHHHWARMRPDNLMLAERLKAVGYRTVGIPAHPFFKRMYGLQQGFDEWDLELVQDLDRKVAFRLTGEWVADRALTWLDTRAQDPSPTPFFLWIHLFDPHFAYKDHEAWDFGEADVDRYDEEIRYTDAQLERVLARLDGAPFKGRTYVVVHSDHGEGFGEHGYRYHGQHLFDDQIHVPLVLAGPGLAPRTVAPPVPLLDVTPTLLDLAGAPLTGDLRGRSLLAWAGDRAPTPRPVFAEMLADSNHSDRRVIIDWPYKLQWGITFGEHTLYDLSVDPGETRDLSREKPTEFRRLYGHLRRWMSEEIEVYRPVRE
ncbi:MAG: sulfatase, partial [Myxococcales bacterium]|nr:sulfatase [Myxococcales bacterium]